MSFITYALSGHELSPPTIFAALAAFNNIRAPLFILPLAFQLLSDAYVALVRISKLMLAQEIDHPVPVLPNAPYAISAHADYGWETSDAGGANAGGPVLMGRDREAAKKKKQEKKAAKALAKKDKAGKAAGGDGTPKETGTPKGEPAAPFQLRDINIDIPRGAFVVACGRVGSGKSSLVQALIGEMKMTRGSSYLGGSTAYCAFHPFSDPSTCSL